MNNEFTDNNSLRICISCGARFDRFLPYGEKSILFSEHRVIGGGYREECLCPYCQCKDRARFQLYVAMHYTSIISKPGIILHIAPEGPLRRILIRKRNSKYIFGDLHPKSHLGPAARTLDLTELPFEDNMFDYVITNHVLEHIKEEGKAISEIRRVLKEDGVWMFSFPICTDQVTAEDTLLDDEEKKRRFGHKSHVRLYGTDYKERFIKHGFDLQVLRPKEIVPKQDVQKYGFIEDDVLILGRKHKGS